MKTTGLSMAALALVITSAFSSVQAAEQREAKVGQCAGLDTSGVAAQVKRDYLQNRITRWESDKQFLGTATPIVWISPESITGKDDVWQVPLSVRGDKGDKSYSVTLNCQTGEIRYSEPK